MELATFAGGVVLSRRQKALIARFTTPHLTLSTSAAGGALQRRIEYAINEQSCEAAGHMRDINYRDVVGYRRFVCEPLGLPPEKTVMMSTAANMHHAAIVRREFEQLEVAAVVTGGVATNAGRAGDPASVVESAAGFVRLGADGRRCEAGTINIMLFISRPLSAAALTRTVITATEAKSVALQELAINSRYSQGLATGTGTDQIIVAAPDPDDDSCRLRWAGKHAKLGELIGSAVIAAVKEALSRQNNITATGQCSAKIHLERFGCTSESMKEGVAACLDDSRAELLRANFQALNRDPLVVAAVAAIAHLYDKLQWEILPAECRPEIFGAFAAQIACAAGGRYDRMEEYRAVLGAAGRSGDFLSLCWQALAAGFADKWPQ